MKKLIIGLVVLLFLVIITNLIWIDIKLFNHESLLKSLQHSTTNTQLFTDIPNTNSNNSEVIKFISDEIKNATASLTSDVNLLKQVKPTNNVVQNNTSQVKEYYLPLGVGSTNATVWTDIPGAEVYISPNNYGKIKEMYFESTIRIPTGNGRAYARLLNVTDNVGLIESEVYRDGLLTGIISSGKVPVPTTTKLYRVQMKSSMGTEIILDSARIKLFIE
jgi:uncharacterized protein YxeA